MKDKVIEALIKEVGEENLNDFIIFENEYIVKNNKKIICKLHLKDGIGFGKVRGILISDENYINESILKLVSGGGYLY